MSRFFRRPSGWPQFRRGQIWNRLSGGYVQPTYATRGPRTFQHAFYGTQPHGYRRGYHGYGGRPYAHMLAGAYRPPRPHASWTTRKTDYGRQAGREMGGLARDYRSERAAKRREFKRGQRDLRRQMRVMEKNDPWAAGDKRYLKLQAQLKAQAASYRSGFKQRRDAYSSQRRSIATQRPMYARVRRHPWYGYSNWGPTRNWLRRRRRYA